MIHLCVTPERREKTLRIMQALKGSVGPHRLCQGAPPVWPARFAVWGQKWTGATIVPPALREGVPFLFVDNGYLMPAKGTADGYYSLTYRSMAPQLLADPDLTRLPVVMGKWRHPAGNPDGPILIAVPGPGYGDLFGWDMDLWLRKVIAGIRRLSDRRIVLRHKSSSRPIVNDVSEAAIMVTHSSKAAVEAVILGLPAIVEPSNAAAPVCGTDLAQIENPPMPDRAVWWASLMCQQFTLEELRNGMARHWLDRAQEQGDREIRPGLPVMSRLIAA